MDKKKILIVTSTFPKSQDDPVTARFVFDLARSLSDFYNVFVIAPHAAGLPLAEEWGNVRIIRFRYFFPARFQLLSSGRGMLNDIRSNLFAFFQIPGYLFAQYLSVIKVARANSITIINSHWIVPQGLVCSLARVSLKFNHFTTVHAADIFTLKRAKLLGTFISRFILRRTDAVFPVSSYIKEQVESVSRLKDIKYEIIPMGVNTECFKGGGRKIRPSGKRSLNMLFVGKMVEKKGLVYLLDSLSILMKEGISFKLNVIGGGPLEDILREHVCKIGLSEHAAFLGWISNKRLPEYYKLNDLLIVPSVFDKRGETEGMPVVILEAMAMSTPVLASRISGIPDIVMDGYNGWLVEPAKAEALAQKIREIYVLDLEPYRDNALKTASSFSYGSIASRYKEAITNFSN